MQLVLRALRLDDLSNEHSQVSEAYHFLSSLLTTHAGLISPPRNWPACFHDPALQKFCEKLAAKRVRLCDLPTAEEAAAANVEFSGCESKGNAEFSASDSRRNAGIVRDNTGWPIIGGFVLYERVAEGGDANAVKYIARPRWWNATGNGVWVDLTPRGEGMSQIVLVESPKTPIPDFSSKEIHTRFRGVVRKGYKFDANYSGEFVDESRYLGSYSTARAAAAAWAHYNKHKDAELARNIGKATDLAPIGPLIA